MYADRLTSTLIELIRIPSTSGHEEKIRAHLAHYLASLGLTTQIDGSGNLVSTLAGEGVPILLNAHMDRVPPGLGHQPIVRNGVLYSDGTTNLGADDAAGMVIILEVVRRTIEQQLPHPPLVIVFTVQEEAGMCGASNFDSVPWQVTDGIVFDNAYEAGLSRASYAVLSHLRCADSTNKPSRVLSSRQRSVSADRQLSASRPTRVVMR